MDSDEIVEPVGEYPEIPPGALLRQWEAGPVDFTAYYPWRLVPMPRLTGENFL